MLVTALLQIRTAFVFTRAQYDAQDISVWGEPLVKPRRGDPFLEQPGPRCAERIGVGSSDALSHVLYVDSTRYVAGDMNLFAYANGIDGVYPLQGDVGRVRAEWSEEQLFIATSFGTFPFYPSAVRLAPCLECVSLCIGRNKETPIVVAISKEQAVTLRARDDDFIDYDVLEEIAGVPLHEKHEDASCCPWVTFDERDSNREVCMNLTHAGIGCLRGGARDGTLYGTLMQSLFRK